MTATTSSDACDCGCRDAGGNAAHAIVAALVNDDLDQAIALGLIGGERLVCEHCSDECRARLVAARSARLQALAARARFRARDARLERRARERAEHRAAPVSAPASSADDAAPQPVTSDTAAALALAPALPSAAAAALARARAKAASRHKP
ncbi:MAG TPA: hypothetical protein VIT90_11830 [Lysobacter sp.]